MFQIRQFIKMFLQNIILPMLYKVYCRRPVERGLVLFADAHHSEMPFSMSRMYDAVCNLSETSERSAEVREHVCRTESSIAEVREHVCRTESSIAEVREPVCGTESSIADVREPVRKAGSCTAYDQGHSSNARDCTAEGGGNIRGASACTSEQSKIDDITGGRNTAGIHVETFITDFDRLSFLAMAKYLVRFMRRYAAAEYVFICDYFLPVSSCDKRPETKVVQLWHACGMLKKIAYEAADDIPKGYRGNMFGNYTYMTVSAKACITPHERAMRLPPGRVFATGVSRTDFYFDEAWNAKCREHFYARHPKAQGRKIILWAPTFRGNAADPKLTGLDEVKKVADRWEKDAYLIIKAHPHIDRHAKVSNCEIPTEELLPAADLLITDYSSILFDWLLYRKPMILYTPDLSEYEAARGFFMDFRSIPFPIAQTGEELEMALEAMNIQAEKDTNKNANSAKNAGGAPERKAGKDETDFQMEKDRLGKDETGFQMEKGTLGKDWMDTHAAEISRFMDLCVGACDGHATERILQLIGLWNCR